MSRTTLKAATASIAHVGGTRVATWMTLVLRTVLALALVTVVGAGPASAQSYPSRVVKLVVPYPPGGVVDLTGRLLAERMQRQLGAQVIVENRPGAGGTIGAHYVSRAEPDGYTLLLAGAATHAFAPWIYRTLPYDPVTDFAPITQIVEGPLVLVVNPNSEAKTVADFIEVMKQRGSSTNYASNGNGTYPHLAVELMKQQVGIDPVHVPYKGGGQALIALLGNEVTFSLNHVPIVLPHLKAGKLRALATSGRARSAVLPESPTLQDSGIDVVASAWFGLFAPANTPEAIIEKVYKAAEAALQTDELRKALTAQGDDVVVEGPREFQAFQKNELEKWRKVIQSAGLKAD